MKTTLIWIFNAMLVCSMALSGCQSNNADQEKKQASAESKKEEPAEESDTTESNAQPEQSDNPVQAEPGLTADEKAALRDEYEQEAASNITLDNAMEEAEALEKQLDEELGGTE